MFNVDNKCARCNAPLHGSVMSKFNQQIICIPCKQDETQAPGYKAAHEAETFAVRNGNYNFPGVGLSSADEAFLAQRRKDRQTAVSR